MKKSRSEIKEVEEEDTHGEGKVEDKLEGELAKLFEEDIAEHYESWSHERQTGGSGIDRREQPTIIDGDIPGSSHDGCHFPVSVLLEFNLPGKSTRRRWSLESGLLHFAVL